MPDLSRARKGPAKLHLKNQTRTHPIPNQSTSSRQKVANRNITQPDPIVSDLRSKQHALPHQSFASLPHLTSHATSTIWCQPSFRTPATHRPRNIRSQSRAPPHSKDANVKTHTRCSNKGIKDSHFTPLCGPQTNPLKREVTAIPRHLNTPSQLNWPPLAPVPTRPCPASTGLQRNTYRTNPNTPHLQQIPAALAPIGAADVPAASPWQSSNAKTIFQPRPISANKPLRNFPAAPNFIRSQSQRNAYGKQHAALQRKNAKGHQHSLNISANHKPKKSTR